MGTIKFGFSGVQSGQKSATVNAEPRLIANSTNGKFSITAPVSKALNLAVGDNIMFLNNIPQLEEAIATRNEDILAFAQERGLDLNTREGHDAIIAEFGTWAIVKGIAEFDRKGNPLMVSERYTKADKEKFIKDNAADILAGNREVLIERVGNPDASDEELIAAISVDDIESPKTQSYTGSKTSTSGNATGVGCQLNFTDTSIWNTLKADLGENKEKKNRVFDVLVDEMFTVNLSDGYKEVECPAFMIKYKADEDPIVRAKA